MGVLSAIHLSVCEGASVSEERVRVRVLWWENLCEERKCDCVRECEGLYYMRVWRCTEMQKKLKISMMNYTLPRSIKTAAKSIMISLPEGDINNAFSKYFTDFKLSPNSL